MSLFNFKKVLDFYNVYELPEEIAKPFRDQITKDECRICGYKGLKDLPIVGYPNHPGGWDINDSSYWWLFIQCPGCNYQWSLWKLGVARERY